MPDAQILNWIIQGGSFGLIVAGCYYVARVLIPKLIATFEGLNAANATLLREMQAKFDEHSRRQEDRADRRESARDASMERLAGSLDKLTDKVDAVAGRIDHLERLTDEHRPLPPGDTPSGKFRRGTP